MSDSKIICGVSKTYCCVPQCKNGAWKSENLSFHKFPHVYEKWPIDKQESTLRRRKEWINILKIGKNVTKTMVVCSSHFQQSDYFPTGNKKHKCLKRNAVPSLNLPLSSVESKEKILESNKKRVEREKRYALISQKKDESINSCLSNDHSLIMDEETVEDIASSEQIAADVLVQLSVTTDVDGSLRTPTFVSTETQVCGGDLMSRVQLRVASLSDKQLNSLTGIISHAHLDFLISLFEVEEYVPERHFLSIKNRVVLALMKLKLNLSFVVLAILFGCTSTTCSTYFVDTIRQLAASFKFSIYWPSKDEVLQNMPACFRSFQNVRVVLDCTEIPLEKPKCLRCRILTYSMYKGNHTVKYLIGVSPGGLITFVSKGYGGRASDSAIVRQSGIIDMVEPFVDAIMVDKGFHINEICDSRGIVITQPPFLKDKKALSPDDSIKTKQIAKARVHVERAIQRIKVFKMLQVGKMPFRFISLADELMSIACGIVNMSNPILSDDKYM